MIDFHTHTIWSDGDLIPAELVHRAFVIGYRAIALTDHVDASNIEHVVPGLVRAAVSLRGSYDITVLPGAELTYVPPALIPEMIQQARNLGARIVVVHGESPVEPVPRGTNAAAIKGGCDILAHPGLITEEDAAESAEKDVCLEISARKGHSLTNGHVAAMALKTGAKLILNTDTHSPSDLITRKTAEQILLGVGLDALAVANTFKNSEHLLYEYEKSLKESLKEGD